MEYGVGEVEAGDGRAFGICRLRVGSVSPATYLQARLERGES